MSRALFLNSGKKNAAGIKRIIRETHKEILIIDNVSIENGLRIGENDIHGKPRDREDRRISNTQQFPNEETNQTDLEVDKLRSRLFIQPFQKVATGLIHARVVNFNKFVSRGFYFCFSLPSFELKKLLFNISNNNFKNVANLGKNIIFGAKFGEYAWLRLPTLATK